MDHVVGVIKNNDEVLIGEVKQSQINNFKGIKYIFPGGKVEKNEKVEDALIREVKEETGLEVIKMEFIDKRVHPDTNKSIYYYLVTVNKFDTDINSKENDDIERLIWINKSEIEEYMPTIYSSVLKFLQEN